MMRIQEEISHNISRFHKLCADHKVKYLYAFGSATTNAFNPSKSDIDLLVDIEISDPLEKGELLIDLWDQFELFFSREVDLLTEESIHNPYLRKSIESTKVLIYDGQREKISFWCVNFQLIEEFTESTATFDAYQSDKKTQSAVEIHLAIIGEAINKLRLTEPEILLVHDVKIISLRNRLVHAYDSIDNTIVWAILKNHLPSLKIEISALLWFRMRNVQEFNLDTIFQMKNHSIAFEVWHFFIAWMLGKITRLAADRLPAEEGVSASADVSTTADRSRACSEKSLDWRKCSIVQSNLPQGHKDKFYSRSVLRHKFRKSRWLLSAQRRFILN